MNFSTDGKIFTVATKRDMAKRIEAKLLDHMDELIEKAIGSVVLYDEADARGASSRQSKSRSSDHDLDREGEDNAL
jgi:hypothetical protein